MRAHGWRIAVLVFVALTIVAIWVMLSLPGERNVHVGVRGNRVMLTVTAPQDFVFEVGTVQMVPLDSTGTPMPVVDLPPPMANGERAVSQRYELSQGTTVTIEWDPGHARLLVTAQPAVSPAPPPPRLGGTEIPFDRALRIPQAAAEEIAVLAGYGIVRLGEHASSNSRAFQTGGSYRFVERVFGGADVTTLTGEIDPFDVIRLADDDKGRPMLADLVIDLTALQDGMGLSLEAGNLGLRPQLVIERRSGHSPTPFAPGPIDRALAHPLGKYLTLLAGLALFFVQLLSVPIGSPSGKVPSQPGEPSTEPDAEPSGYVGGVTGAAAGGNVRWHTTSTKGTAALLSQGAGVQPDPIQPPEQLPCHASGKASPDPPDMD